MDLWAEGFHQRWQDVSFFFCSSPICHHIQPCRNVQSASCWNQILMAVTWRGRQDDQVVSLRWGLLKNVKNSLFHLREPWKPISEDTKWTDSRADGWEEVLSPSSKPETNLTPCPGPGSGLRCSVKHHVSEFNRLGNRSLVRSQDTTPYLTVWEQRNKTETGCSHHESILSIGSREPAAEYFRTVNNWNRPQSWTTSTTFTHEWAK